MRRCLYEKKSSYRSRTLRPIVASRPGTGPGRRRTTSQASNGQDLYYSRQEKKDLIISSDNKVPHSFYGLQIGDKKSDALKKLRPAFKFMYELKAIGNEYLLSDVVYPDYYLTIMSDEKDRVFMIRYQENQKYELL